MLNTRERELVLLHIVFSVPLLYSHTGMREKLLLPLLLLFMMNTVDKKKMMISISMVNYFAM